MPFLAYSIFAAGYAFSVDQHLKDLNGMKTCKITI